MLFPHLDPDASWTSQQEAGDRMRKLYEAGAAQRQASAIGKVNVHLGRVLVMDGRSRGSYCIGLDYAFVMGRGMIVHRAMARQYPADRRHHLTNALRIRGALCWGGLDTKMRK